MTLRRYGLAALACASSATAAVIPIEQPPAERAPLLPVVRLIVNGISAPYLLDTGASRTAIARSALARLGLAERQPGTGHDGLGAAIAIRALDPIVFSTPTGDVAGRADAPVALDLPPLEARGLAGVVSPQTLAVAGCVEADFAQARLSLGIADRPDMRADYAGSSPEWAAGGVVHAMVAIGDAPPFPALLDSGATRTILPEGRLGGIPRLAEASRQGASGATRSIALAGPVTLTIGSRSIRLDAVGIAPDDRGARIGFDLLAKADLMMCRGGRLAIRFAG